MMRTTQLLAVAGLALAAPTFAQDAAPQVDIPPQTADEGIEEMEASRPGVLDLGDGVVIDLDPRPAPIVEVVFVLDTTGSMSGLIEGAKQTIWSIANEIIAAEPKPTVRMGLVGYRDRGDAYVTTLTALTDDIDAVYADLMGYQAQGGGDGPESVNQALAEAVNAFEWTPRESASDVVRIVYLVGDAPPHMDYEQDTHYPQSCEQAVTRGIIVNAIQCGSVSDTKAIWEEIARLGEGDYSAIDQSGGVEAIETPFDEALNEASRRLGETMVVWGDEAQRAAGTAWQARSEDLAESAPVSARADRALYMSKAGGAAYAGRDLVAAIDAGVVALDSLDDEQLPPQMQEMSAEERVSYIATQRDQRTTIESEITSLGKQRAAYLVQEEAKRGGRAGFDVKVVESLHRQLQRAGLKIEAQREPPANETPATADAPEAKGEDR